MASFGTAMKNHSNLAYQQPKQQEELRQPKIVKVPKAKPVKRTSPVKVLACMAVVLVMASSIMYSRAQLTELSAQVTSASKKLDELESENVRLTTELEKQLSLKNVEEYAATELGLEKLDPAQVEYVTLTEGNRVEVKEETEPSVWQKIKNIFVDMMEYIGW